MKAIFPAGAAKPVAPYSPGMDVGALVLLSGQIGIDPSTGAMVKGGTDAECAQVFRNIITLLEAAGLTLANVAKTTVFLPDMTDFPVVNAHYERNFTEPFPARSTIGVAALPVGARVEIEVIATRD